jgi:tight adherence protein C
MNPLGFIVVLATLGVAYVAATSWSLRQRALRRLYAEEDVARAAVPIDVGAEHWLTRWLSRAGYRSPNATGLFVAATAISVGVGLAVGQIYRVTMLRSLVDMVASAPGSTGDVLAATLQGGPWILFVVAALGPMLVVRTARRSRVRDIEQDLPLALELFATMAEAGLGFDAALAKIARARGTDRPLIAEFINFQVDVLAGIPRVQALRQLARRVEVPSLTRFTSALIQAEQAGASMAETLQHQADDLRQRRREDALLQAQALPVKLVFPLVMCFLPGIFVSTLAPVISQLLQVANSVVRSAGR